MSATKVSCWRLVGLCFLLRFDSLTASCHYPVPDPCIVIVASRSALLFSAKMKGYLLDLFLKGPNFAEGTGDDVIETVI